MRCWAVLHASRLAAAARRLLYDMRRGSTFAPPSQRTVLFFLPFGEIKWKRCLQQRTPSRLSKKLRHQNLTFHQHHTFKLNIPSTSLLKPPDSVPIDIPPKSSASLILQNLIPILIRTLPKHLRLGLNIILVNRILHRIHFQIMLQVSSTLHISLQRFIFQFDRAVFLCNCLCFLV